MGAEVELGYGRAHHRTTICARTLAAPEASYELVKTMRASTLVLGPLLARCGHAPRLAARADAPLALGQSICISRGWNVWAQKSRRSMATLRRSPIRLKGAARR